jgi:hypothetical protein
MGTVGDSAKLDYLVSNLAKLNLQEDLSLQNSVDDFVITIGDQSIACNRELLRRNSKFFEGFFNFDPSRASIHIEGGGLDYPSCQALIQFWQSSQLDVSSRNVQDLLLGKYCTGTKFC